MKANFVLLPEWWGDDLHKRDRKKYGEMCRLIDNRLRETDEYEIVLGPFMYGFYISGVDLHFVTWRGKPLTQRYGITQTILDEQLHNAVEPGAFVRAMQDFMEAKMDLAGVFEKPLSGRGSGNGSGM